MAKFGSTASTTPAPAASPALTAPAQAGGMFGGLFPSLSPQARYDMAMGMLKNGMAAAGQTNNPTLAFLAPLAGGLIGGRIQSRYDDAQKASTDKLIASMAPGGMPAGMSDLMAAASDPSVPDYMRSIATDRIKEALKPSHTGSGRGTGVSSDGRSASGQPLYDSFIGEDGLLYGKTRGGDVRPYKLDGKPFRPKARGKPSAMDALDSAAPTDDPMGLNGDGSATSNDPLGIR